MLEFHAIGVKEALIELETRESGLTQSEADERLARYGPNELRKEKGETVLTLFLNQFKSFLIIILLVAAIVSFTIGEGLDSAVIMAIVILNAIIGLVQDYRAEKSLEALKKMAAPSSVVLRDGREVKIPSAEIVPGDILLLEAGDKISADARLIEVIELKVSEAALTGESLPVAKSIEKLGEKTALADRNNMVYSGTLVVYGKGKAVVTATAMRTELGRIASMVQSAERDETPLQKKLAVVGRQLGIAVLGICAMIFFTGMLRVGWTPEHLSFMFLAAVSLAVAAIPEGLPAVVTMVLALGTQRMSKRNAIIRKLPAVETLGSCDVICSDKTGTFTKNEMTVKAIWISSNDIEVSGSGYSTQGGFSLAGKDVDPHKIDGLERLAKGLVLCNNASLENELGDPTEIALLAMARKMGIKQADAEAAGKRVREVPFDSERKMMSTINKSAKGFIVYTKGATEAVLSICSHIYMNGRIVKLSAEERRVILKKNDDLAKKALRVLSLAYKEIDGRRGSTELNSKNIESDLVFLGMVGMIDPPREGIKESVALCIEAGIDVKMITGDHAITARAIAEEIGLPKGEVVTGEELENMSDEELSRRVEGISIFARVNPEHKLRIVEALKSRGHVVAMTGDGVNDAPALKKADIGIAMGITGTEVTKEAGSMVLSDDNFSTIVSAIEEGRVIYNNIKRFIRFLLSSNVGEVMTLFLGILVFPLKETVLIPVQLLWVNLVTDGAPALALGVEPKKARVMKRPPRDPKEGIFSGIMLRSILVVSIVMATGTLGVYYMFNPGFETGTPAALKAGTMAFTTLMMFQMVNAINCKTEKSSLFKAALFDNKWLLLAIAGSVAMQAAVIYLPVLSGVFDTVPLDAADWAIVILVSLSVLVAVEISKFFERRLARRRE